MTDLVAKINAHDKFELHMALRAAIANYNSHYEICKSRDLPTVAAEWLTRIKDVERILDMIDNAEQINVVRYIEPVRSSGV